MFKIRFIVLLTVIALCSNIVKAQHTSANTLTQEKKIFILSEIWKEVSYNFYDPQRLQQINWDSLYVSNIKETVRIENDYDFYLLLKKFMASVQDGHTMFDYQNAFESLSLGELPFGIQDIGGKYYVIAFAQGNSNNINLGDNIQKINEIPVQDYMNKYVLPYSHGSTSQWSIKYALGNIFGSGEVGDSIKIQLLSREGRETTSWFPYIQRSKLRSAPYTILPSIRSKQKFELLDDSILYMNITGFSNRNCIHYLQNNVGKSDKISGIIIDLRNNEGGNEEIADSLLMCFRQDTILKTYKSITRTNNAFFSAMGYGFPAYKSFYENTHVDTLKEDVFYKGQLPTYLQPLVVLIGPRTCSAAEDFLLALKINFPERAILIGTPTAGSTGAPLVRQVNSEVYYKICTRKPLVDPKLFKNGIIPDIFYEKTIDEYLCNTDKIMEIAKGLIHKKQSSIFKL